LSPFAESSSSKRENCEQIEFEGYESHFNFTLRKEDMLGLLENRMLRKIFGPKRSRSREKLHKSS
jgi:hypothetical protein